MGDYIIKNHGGFLSNNKNKTKLIRKSHKNIGETKLHTLDIVNTINYLSSVKYCINNNVLNYIFNLLEINNEHILNLIKIDLHPKTKEAYKSSAPKIKKYELNEILKHNSQFYSDKTILQTALLFSN